MEKREFVMLAQNWDPLKNKTEGSFLSEKLDGMRAIWIPQTRGMNFTHVMFANTNRDDREHVCTGLWTRYAKPIFAPTWFLDQFPTDHCLDGELYCGRGKFQEVMSICKKHKPEEEMWRGVSFLAFDIPSYSQIFIPGRINNPNFAEKIIPNGAATQFGIDVFHDWYKPRRFALNYQTLAKKFPMGVIPGKVCVHEQTQLSFSRFDAEALVETRLRQVLDLGGEGLILRRPHSEWQPRRSLELLKVKRTHDMEGMIVGVTYGTGKLHGMMGSLRVRLANGKEFDLSGFTDAERELKYEYRGEANSMPSMYTTSDVCKYFTVGDSVTFAYRELTDSGLPKEARYIRKYEV
jgi:DNA ligase-1